jgi:hypothetical protein
MQNAAISAAEVATGSAADYTYGALTCGVVADRPEPPRWPAQFLVGSETWQLLTASGDRSPRRW